MKFIPPLCSFDQSFQTSICDESFQDTSSGHLTQLLSLIRCPLVFIMIEIFHSWMILYLLAIVYQGNSVFIAGLASFVSSLLSLIPISFGK
jgi:hypothetical protein